MTPVARKAKRAIIYARLSPSPRGEEAKGGNLDQQVEISQARCDAEGWQVVEIITEKDTSATSRKPRVGWQRVVEMVRKHEADVVVGRHYDRLYRRPADLEELVALTEDTGVLLVAAEADAMGLDLTTATGRAQARFMAAGAAMETDIKRERQVRGHERRAKDGRPFWTSRPFGFERDTTQRKAEAELLRKGYSDLLAGATLYGIAQQWNEAGILTPRGNTWRSSNLRTVFLHPRNAGIHTYTPAATHPQGKGSRPQPSGYEAQWEPIVSVEVFEAVTALLNSPERHSGGGGWKRRALLTHIAHCGKCDGLMGQLFNKPRSDGSRLRKYSCRECRGTSIDADFLDDYVINRVIFKAPQIVAAKLGDAEEGGLSEDEKNALRAEQIRLGVKKEELVEDFNDDLIDRAAMRKGVASANARIEEITQILADNAANKIGAERWARDIEAMFSMLDYMAEDRSQHDELRRIITDVVVHLKILPRQKGRRFSTPEDVDLKLVVDE